MKLWFSKERKGKFSKGIEHRSAIENTLYYFIIENKIDWVILFGSIFSTLPYLGSSLWFFILLKVIILLVIIIISYYYMIIWKKLKEYEDLELEFNIKAKKLINAEHEVSDAELRKLTTRIFEWASKLKAENALDKINDENIDSIKDEVFFVFINGEKILLNSRGLFALFLMGVMFLNKLKSHYRSQLNNYYRLLVVMILTSMFFLVYFVEVTFYLGK